MDNRAQDIKRITFAFETVDHSEVKVTERLGLIRLFLPGGWDGGNIGVKVGCIDSDAGSMAKLYNPNGTAYQIVVPADTTDPCAIAIPPSDIPSASYMSLYSASDTSDEMFVIAEFRVL